MNVLSIQNGIAVTHSRLEDIGIMTEQRGSWGGSRPGAGNPEFKPKWKSGKTTVIRVPEAIASEVLTVARQIDDGKAVTLSSKGVTAQLEQENSRVTQSSEVDDLKEEVRRLQAVVGLEKQQKEMLQHKLDKAQQSNKELMNLAREARAELEQLQEQVQNNNVTQSSVRAIDLEEFYDAVILKHPPRERKLVSKPLMRFKALIAEALTRRGVPVR